MITFDPRGLSGLRVISQNVRSLNLSSYKNGDISSKFLIKMQAILSSRADIIFLSDIKAASNRHNQIKDFLKCTPFGNYNIVFNSDSSIKRGVAIVYNTALDLKIDDTYRSDDFNVLLINVSLKGQELTLGSIYGPKAEDNTFF